MVNFKLSLPLSPTSSPVGVPGGLACADSVAGNGSALFSARGCLEALDDAPAETGLFGGIVEADCRITRGDTSTRILFPSAPISAGFCTKTVSPSPAATLAGPT